MKPQENRTKSSSDSCPERQGLLPDSQLMSSSDVILNGINTLFGNMPIDIQLKNLKQVFTNLIALPAMLAVILAWTALDESVAQLRIDYAALTAAEDDYRAQREFGGLSGEEAADYAAYVARLQRRVFEDCKAVRDSGSSIPDDLPLSKLCPAANPGGRHSHGSRENPARAGCRPR